MKTLFASLAISAVACTQALAGAGAPVPDRPEGGDPSGRPGEILDAAACGKAWDKAAGGAETLTAEQAGPMVANVEMVDADSDGKITKDEFEQGCAKGMVQEQASKAEETGGGETPENPEGE